MLDPSWLDFVRLWHTCRGEHGIAHWPAAGSVEDQAAWLVDAFATLSAIDAQWRAEDIRGGG